jgi:tRNA-splicing ligase RtcB
VKPHKIFAEYVEGAALDQFYEAMKHDTVVQGALMPDAHKGYALPIGAVVAMKDVVWPAAVGYDIGCGMCALPTTFDKGQVENQTDTIFERIYEQIPVGFNWNKKRISFDTTKELEKEPITHHFKNIYDEKGVLQIGTLGGGNHFIEIGYDETDNIWIIIHSGSRNLGHNIATHYMKAASPDNKAREGYYVLDFQSIEGENYVTDLNYALHFALLNRAVMMDKVEKILSKLAKGHGNWDSLINRNHNHAELKDGLWIHRKGATHAENGMAGVIPGNMRDGSFIVEGKGNPESLYSSSHGAGRVLGRRAAKETLTMEDFKKSMKGIKAKVGTDTIDESPGAYKNIFDVMEQQKDLVEVMHHVKPIINIKG